MKDSSAAPRPLTVLPRWLALSGSCTTFQTSCAGGPVPGQLGSYGGPEEDHSATLLVSDSCSSTGGAARYTQTSELS